MKFDDYVKKYDSTKDTQKHIDRVIELCNKSCDLFQKQYMNHDKSKLSNPEKELFDIYTPKLKDCEFNSSEYKTYLKELSVALEHHYSKNRHHPEHFKNGIKEMTLFDILEMLCDWVASSERNKNGNPYKSIDELQERFGYSNELKEILKNTLDELMK